MSVMRKVLLAMSTSTFLREQATRRAFVRKSVSAFMPGEKIEDALAAAATLQPQKITTILTRLGEGVTKLDDAETVTQHYLDVLDKVKAAGLDAQISVKPTQLGLDLDAEQCQRNLDRICEKGERLGNTPVWIDMENSPYVDPTLKLFRKSRERYRGVGIALQAYLYRTAKDLEALIPLGPAVRIVKGAYLEPAEVAYPEESLTSTRISTRCARGWSQEDAIRRPAPCCTSPRTTSPSPIASPPTSTSTRCRLPATSTRCSTASSAASSSGWRRAAAASASSSATANTGIRGTCAGSPNARRT